jgi:hypothetical protein
VASPNLSGSITFTDGASAVLRQVRGEVERTNATATKGGTAAAGYGAAWGKAALGIGAATIGVGALLRGLQDAAEAAAEDQKSVTQLNTVLGNLGMAGAAADTREWVDSMQMALGVSDDLLRSGLRPLMAATKDAAKSQELMALALDIQASGFANGEAAAKALALAYGGNTTALRRLKIPIDDAILQSKDFTRITQELARVVGGSAAAAAETASGKWARLNQALGELQESAGTGVIDMFESLDSAMGGTEKSMTVLQAAGDNLEQTGRGLGLTVQFLAEGLKLTNPLVRLLGDNMGEVVSQTAFLNGSFANLANGFDMIRATLDSTSDSYYRMITLLTDAEMGYRDAEGAIHIWKSGVETVVPASKAAADALAESEGYFADWAKEVEKSKDGVTDLARAMGLLDARLNQQQALQSWKDDLKSYLEEPSADTARAMASSFMGAVDSFKEGGRRQREFIVENYDDMVRAIRNSGMGKAAQAELIDPITDAYNTARRLTAVLDALNGKHVSVSVTMSQFGAAAPYILNQPVPDPPKPWATGGLITGPGTGTSDSIPARLSNGEYVIRAAAVRKVGRNVLDALNSEGFARGGPVGRNVAGAILQSARQVLDPAYLDWASRAPAAAPTRGWSDLDEQLAREMADRHEQLLNDAKRAAEEQRRWAEEQAREEARRAEELARMQQAAIDLMQDALDEAMRTRDGLARTIAQAGMDYGSITGYDPGGDDWAALSRRAPGSPGAGGAAQGPASISGFMAGRLERVRAFGDVLNQLSNAGLNAYTLRELWGQGPEAGYSLGKALLDAGVNEVAQVNTLQMALAQQSASNAAAAANRIYGGYVGGAYREYNTAVAANGGVDRTPVQLVLNIDGRQFATAVFELDRLGIQLP